MGFESSLILIKCITACCYDKRFADSQHMESGKQACVQRAKQTHEDCQSRLPRCTRYDSKASEVYKQGYFNESDGEKIQDM